MQELPSPEQLKQWLRYVPDTGALVWREGMKHAGSLAGGIGSQGYRVMKINGRHYQCHRVAIAIATGAWPIGQVDHINGDRKDNRLANLRDVSGHVNQQNARRPRRNNVASGLLGVSRNKKRWAAQIHFGGKRHYLGLFDTPEMAHAAYLQAKRVHHEGCTI